MRPRQHRYAFLMSAMTLLWSICQGRPADPGPTCAEELPNALHIISWLQKSLKELNKTLVNEGFGGREFGGPVCILSNADIRDQSMDLHTIDRILCQYNLCFKHFESVIREFNTLQNSYELCWKFLHQLENTIKKMKGSSLHGSRGTTPLGSELLHQIPLKEPFVTNSVEKTGARKAPGRLQRRGQTKIRSQEDGRRRQPPASCTALWSYNDSRWDEITKVPHLTQELLKYLEYLRPACH